MLKRVGTVCLTSICLALFCTTAWCASLEEGSVELQTAGPLAFGPDGMLFVGDTQAAVIYAIATEDKSGNPESVSLNINGLGEKIAGALGASPRQIRVGDMAVNPLSGNVYLSVARGQGPNASALLLKLDPSGDISEVPLKNVKFAKAELPNPPAQPAAQQNQQNRQRQGQSRRGGRNRNRRVQSITDLAFVDGKLIVAGLSNEEFASTLRSIPYPFESVNKGTAVEIFHGAHGRFETSSPVRTFATYAISGEPHLLAAYTCTPLVKFSLNDLAPGKKVMGTTVAELGNRNTPLDMFIYKQDGKDYVLMANTSRGVMKISTDGLDREKGITEKVDGGSTAGQDYKTIESLSDVVQLDRLNSKNALVLMQPEDGSLKLQTVALP